jgi:hypothetical protein
LRPNRRASLFYPGAVEKSSFRRKILFSTPPFVDAARSATLRSTSFTLATPSAFTSDSTAARRNGSARAFRRRIPR